MRQTWKPQPYFNLPTLRPEGNAVETLYGNRTRRYMQSGSIYTVPVGVTEIFTSFTTDIVGVSDNSWKLGRLLKENQILVPIYAFAVAGNAVRTSPITTANILNVLNAEVNLSNNFMTYATFPIQNFAIGTTLNGYNAGVRVELPPIKWDDYDSSIVFSPFENSPPRQPMIKSDARFEVHANILNSSAGSLTASLLLNILFDIMTLEEYFYGKAA